MPSSSRNSKKSSNRSVLGLWPPAGFSRTIVLAILVLASTLGVYYVSYSHAAQAELVAGWGGSGGESHGAGESVDGCDCDR